MINYEMAEFTALMQLLQHMTECLFLFVLKTLFNIVEEQFFFLNFDVSAV